MSGSTLFRLGAVLWILLLTSCEKIRTPVTPVNRPLKVWLHRANTIDKARHFQYQYSGLELDVHYDTVYHTFLVKHDASDTTVLFLTAWLSALDDPGHLGFWLDFKNLSADNMLAASRELLRIRDLYNLTRQTIVVESPSPEYLHPFDTLNFRISFYIPTFDPSTVTPEEELNFRNFINSNIEETWIRTLSADYVQHGFMQQWYPRMNKLLWYLSSWDQHVKDSVINVTRRDFTVEVLLVGEGYGSILLPEAH